MTASNMKDISRFLNDKGQVTIWPKKQADKLLVLEYLVNKFVYGQIYKESEINEILNQWHTFQDWPLLRRSLVDSGYLLRDRSGYAYRRP